MTLPHPSSALEADLPGRQNSFDLLRLVAAVMVLVSHSFPLVGEAEPELAGVSLGGFGVIVFFAISGYLVTRSWVYDQRLGAFAAKRGLRLLPALAVCVLVTAYVIGPLATSLELAAYLTSPEPLLHVVHNVRLSSHYVLPGVFESTPFEGVNGSLWTLPIEARAYLLIAVLGFFRSLRRALVPALATVVVLMYLYDELEGLPAAGAHLSSSLSRAGLTDIALKLIGVFSVGALLFVHRDRVPLRPRFALVAFAGWLAALAVGLEPLASVVLLPYVVLCVGFLDPGRLAVLTRPGDVSYGLYLWAFPIQQCIVSVVGPGLTPLGMMVLALPVTYGLALVSWRLVEAPALRLKGRVARPARPRPAPAAAA